MIVNRHIVFGNPFTSVSTSATWPPITSYYDWEQREEEPQEWRCDYCSAVNLYVDRECEKCGSPRPFVHK